MRHTGLPAAWRGGLLAFAGGAVILALGVRTIYRNVDWLDEKHLWTSAADACPNSYKVHQSLAMAIYEANPDSLPAIDQAIAVARRGIAVLDNPVLPPLDTPGRPLRELAIFYMARADALTRGRSPVPAAIEAEIDAGYQVAAAGLERAVVADHAVNEASRAYRARRQGKRPDEVPDVGISYTYKALGALRMRMKQWDQAAAAFAYMRRLNPTDPSGYDLNAEACLEAGRYDQAAVLQIQAWIGAGVTADTYPRLTEIYRHLSPDSPAVSRDSTGRISFHQENPLVRRHLALAFAGLIRAFRDFGQADLARNIQRQATAMLGYAPDSAGRAVP
jgi:tetratricopeptide (TPR) repeat protein